MAWLFRIVSALVALLALLPVVGTLWLWWNPPPPLFGVAPTIDYSSLFVRELADGSTQWGPLPRSLVLSFCVCVLSLGLGTALGWLSTRADYPGRRVLSALGLVPFAIPSYLLAMGLRSAFGAETFRGLVPSIIVLTLATSPFAQLMISAVLRRLGGAEEEAARLLGASPWTNFRTILWPRLRPAVSYAFLLTLLYVIADFGVVDVLDCEVLTWSLFQAYEDQQLERAALMGLGLVMCVLPIVLTQRFLHGDATSEKSATQERPAARLNLGLQGRTLAYVVHAIQIGLGIILPLTTLLTWVFPSAFRDASFDFAFSDLIVIPLITSIGIAALTTLVVLCAVFVPAWIAAKSQRRQTLTEITIFGSQALPGVLVALGLLALFLALSRALDQPLHDQLRQASLLLLGGLTIRFLASAYGAIKSAVLRLDPRQAESARLLGSSGARRFVRVQLPALIPGISSAALLVSVGVLKELPITLMLIPRGLSPLSYRLYERYGEGALTEAGLVGLTMAIAALTLQACALKGQGSS